MVTAILMLVYFFLLFDEGGRSHSKKLYKRRSRLVGVSVTHVLPVLAAISRTLALLNSAGTNFINYLLKFGQNEANLLLPLRPSCNTGDIPFSSPFPKDRFLTGFLMVSRT